MYSSNTSRAYETARTIINDQLEVKTRINLALDEIYQEANDGDKILIVFHDGALVAYLGQYVNFPYQEIITSNLPPLDNCALAHVKYTNEN